MFGVVTNQLKTSIINMQAIAAVTQTLMTRWSRLQVNWELAVQLGHMTDPCAALEPSTPAETPTHCHVRQATHHTTVWFSISTL